MSNHVSLKTQNKKSIRCLILEMYLRRHNRQKITTWHYSWTISQTKHTWILRTVSVVITKCIDIFLQHLLLISLCPSEVGCFWSTNERVICTLIKKTSWPLACSLWHLRESQFPDLECFKSIPSSDSLEFYTAKQKASMFVLLNNRSPLNMSLFSHLCQSFIVLPP